MVCEGKKAGGVRSSEPCLHAGRFSLVQQLKLKPEIISRPPGWWELSGRPRDTFTTRGKKNSCVSLFSCRFTTVYRHRCTPFGHSNDGRSTDAKKRPTGLLKASRRGRPRQKKYHGRTKFTTEGKKNESNWYQPSVTMTIKCQRHKEFLKFV